jgi:hypothetical protein
MALTQPTISTVRMRPKGSGTTYLGIPGYDVGNIATATFTFTANTTYYYPLQTFTTITLSQIVLLVSTGAGTSTRLAIYNADADMEPTSRVLDAGTVTTSTNGTKTASISQALAPGNYLLALNTDGAIQCVGHRGSVGMTNVGANPTIHALPIAAAGIVAGGFPSTGTAWTTPTFGTTGFQFVPLVQWS